MGILGRIRDLLGGQSQVRYDHQAHLAGAYAVAQAGRLAEIQAMQAYTARAATADRATLVNLSRDATRQNPLARSIKRAYIREIVGRPGMTSSAAATHPISGELLIAFNTEIDRLYADHCEHPDRFDLHGIQAMVDRQATSIGERVEAGEAFIVWSYVPQKDFVGLFTQMMEPELLDRTILQYGGNAVVDGIEVDGDGKIVAYHFRNEDPITGTTLGESFRVPRERCWHVYEQERPRQVHGIPILTSSLQFMSYLAGYVANTAVNAMFQACHTAAIETDAAADDTGQGLPLEQAETTTGDTTVPPMTKMYPGQVVDLGPGKKLNLQSPSQPQGVFGPFVQMGAAIAGAGSGVDSHRVLRDYSGGNYSSLRLGTIDFEEETAGEERILVNSFLRKHRRLFTELAIMEGRCRFAPKYFFTDPAWRETCLHHIWKGKATVWVDPSVDAKAAVLEASQDIRSVNAIVQENGGDLRQNIKERFAADRLRIDEMAAMLDYAQQIAKKFGISVEQLIAATSLAQQQPATQAPSPAGSSGAAA